MNDLNFVNTDTKQILNQLILGFEAAYGETLYPGDERWIFLNQMAQVVAGMYVSINDTGRQNLLAFARGSILDMLGERVNTPRLPAAPAGVTIRFTLASALAADIIIPAGVRVTPDGQLYFATVKDLTVYAGNTSGDVEAKSVEGGSRYNGYAPGQIKTLVDPVAYVASIANTSTSSGGRNVEPDDDGVNIWSGYRERIREAPAGFSTAGPSDSYAYWAKTADAGIIDVKVTSPSDGRVNIIILMDGGQLPAQAVLDAVKTVCSDRTRRPVTDLVSVSDPATQSYDINLTYYISRAKSPEESIIRNSIESAGGIVDQYKTWQRSALGRDINPDYLRQLMLNAGAYRIDITAPVFAAVDDDKVAIPGTVTINYGGLL